MISINLRFGSKRLAIYPNDYGEDNATCHYWSAPLDKSYKGESDIALWSNGVEEPIGRTDLSSRTLGWDLPALTKLSLCNWWTPNTVRYVEWWRSIAPQGMHFYWSSGRDEATDKVMKCLIKKRPKAHRALSFQGAYWGHTTACCRSLSDLGLAISGYFDWPHLPYPEVTEGSPFEGNHDEGKEAKFWQQLRVWENKSDQLLGIFVEPFQERTGRFLSQEFLLKLQKWCRDQDVPLILNESASWAYRLSDQMFFSQAAGLDPDAIVVYAGGQMGHALLNDKYFIDTPLAMISTWDGDELSGLRLQTQIQMVQEYLERYGSPEQWDEQLRAMGGVVYRGHGTIPRSRVTAFHQHQLWPSSVSGYQSILLPPLTEWVIEGQEQVKAWEEGFHG